MPTTKKSFGIGVKSSASTNKGEKCKVTNFTSGGTITGEFTASNECVMNPADSNLTWSNGDTLMVEVSGRLLGSKQVTLTKGGINAEVTTAADTSSPAISL